ncbi:MAG: hypothetical protein JXA78_18745 [Anaerolineales bacterium]|nr:hypothetical protein [Anaerolineales bacterium]
MKSFRNTAAFLFAAANVVLLVVALSLLNLRLTLLNPDYLSRLPARHDLYDDLPQAVLEAFQEADIAIGDTQIIQELVNRIGRQELETLIAALLPADWLQAQWQANIEAIFAWLQGDTDTPLLQLDTSALRQNVYKPAVRQAIVGLFASLPQCGWDDYFSLLFGEVPTCRPEQALLAPFIDEVALPGLEALFPDQDPLKTAFDPGRIDAGARRELDNLRLGYRLLSAGAWLSWLLAFVGLGVVLLLAARSVQSALGWAGGQILAAGALSVLLYGLSFLLPIGLELWLRSLLQEGEISSFSFFLGSTWLTAMLNDMLGFWLLGALVLSLLGVCALGLAFLLSRLRA